MNLAAKLPPRPLLLPGTVLLFAVLFLVATLLVQGRALRESALATGPVAALAKGDRDAPLPAAARGADLAPLANSDLFGHYDPATAHEAEAGKEPAKPAAALGDKAPDSLPEASLALKVQGIVYKQDPAQRRAIIAGDGPLPEARKIGETLLGNAVIRYIEARRVVVEQQGELKALTLVDPSLSSGPGAFAQAIPPMPGSPAASLPPAQIEQAPPEEPQYEAPPEDADSSVQYEESPPTDESSDADSGEAAQ